MSGGIGAPLAADAFSALNDFHVLVYRLFGVHAVIHAPFVPEDRNPWDRARPVLCGAVRWKPGMMERCDACESRLRARARVRAATGLCHAGLGQVAIPLRMRRRTVGHVLCSPARFSANPARTLRLFRIAVGEIGGVLDVSEEVREMPVLDRDHLAALEAFVGSFFRSFFSRLRRPFRTDAHWYHLPVRAPDDTEAWVSFLWTGYEPQSDEPRVRGWIAHRSHDVLVYAVRAPVTIQRPGSRITVRRGELLLLPAGHRYRVVPGAAPGSGDPFWIHFVSNVDLTGLALKPFVPTADVRGRIRAVDRETAGGFPSWYGTEAKLKVLELLLTLKAQIGRASVRGGVARGRDSRPGFSEGVERVRRYLEAAVDRRVRLKELAELAGMNPFTLCRKFREETGTAPLAYHRRLRLQEAARLLSEDGLPAKEVARRLAFPSPQYFSRAFRRHAGVPPGAVRRTGGRRVNKG